MKIGDKVSFLSSQGSGTVAGFQGKNIVLVEDEDGFQIPTLVNDVVVLGSSDDYDISNVVRKRNESKAVADETEETEPADRPITFRAAVEERKEGNKINCYLAFVPSDPKNLSKTHFECYFVNDSNYYIRYVLLRQEHGSHSLHHTEEVQPNMLAYIEDIGYADLNSLEHICIQLLAYKREKSFLKKAAMSVDLRLDLTKFYKLHCFTENDFFETPALLVPVVADDRPVGADDAALRIDGKADLRQLQAETNSPQRGHGTAEQNTYVRRYEKPGQQQRNPFLPKHKKEEVVIDLHATAILDSTAGLKPKEILDYQLDTFRRRLDEYKNKPGTRLVFIHGKGEGVLRQAIINELRHTYKSYTYQDASFLEYGYGATLVVIK